MREQEDRYVVRNPDMKIVVGIGLAFGLVGLETSNIALEVIRNSNAVDPVLLSHPLVLAVKAGATLSFSFAGMGFGFDVERWANGK